MQLPLARGSCRPGPEYEAHTNCETASSGIWPRLTSIDACVAACISCANCNYVSFRVERGCSWYSMCDLDFGSLVRSSEPVAGVEHWVTAFVEPMRRLALERETSPSDT